MNKNTISVKDLIRGGGLKKEITSQLVQLPTKQRIDYETLIKDNIDHFALMVVQPKKPVQLTVKLHPEHLIQLKAGWIKSITLVQESDLQMHEGHLLLKADIDKMLNAKKE